MKGYCTLRAASAAHRCDRIKLGAHLLDSAADSQKHPAPFHHVKTQLSAQTASRARLALQIQIRTQLWEWEDNGSPQVDVFHCISPLHTFQLTFNHGTALWSPLQPVQLREALPSLPLQYGCPSLAGHSWAPDAARGWSVTSEIRHEKHEEY
jgi:hypothetical protein